ncbi:hypothetical protein LV85_03566, partial [Algoriphagus chordae]
YPKGQNPLSGTKIKAGNYRSTKKIRTGTSGKTDPKTKNISVQLKKGRLFFGGLYPVHKTDIRR